MNYVFGHVAKQPETIQASFFFFAKHISDDICAKDGKKSC